MKYFLFLIGLSLVPFQSCTTPHKMGDNQKSSGHYRLYTYPDKIKKPKNQPEKKRYKKIVIASSNDINGLFVPDQYKVPDPMGHHGVLSYGGIPAMRAYLDIFEKTFKDSFMYVDAGSFLQKERNHFQSILMHKYLGVEVASLGSNELMIDLPANMNLISYLSTLTSKANYDIVNSNLFDLVNAQPVKLSGTKEYTIKEVNGIKIGFISVLTKDVAKSIPDKKINGLYIQNPIKSVIAKSTMLKRLGAHMIVLMANKGIDCTTQLSHALDLPESKVNFDPMDSSHCDSYQNELYNVLTKVPPQTIDLAITSGGQGKVANFINGTPVMQNSGGAKYLSWVELYFDTKFKRTVPQMTKLHQPVMLCHKFLKDHQDCYKEGSLRNEDLEPARFLGHQINIENLPASLPRLE